MSHYLRKLTTYLCAWYDRVLYAYESCSLPEKVLQDQTSHLSAMCLLSPMEFKDTAPDTLVFEVPDEPPGWQLEAINIIQPARFSPNLSSHTHFSWFPRLMMQINVIPEKQLRCPNLAAITQSFQIHSVQCPVICFTLSNYGVLPWIVTAGSQLKSNSEISVPYSTPYYY